MRSFVLSIVAGLLMMGTCSALAQETQSYKYVKNEVMYTLHVMPYDEKSAELIRKYTIRTLEGSLGARLDLDLEMLRLSDLKPMITSKGLLLREGYTRISDKDFQQLIARVSDRFQDLRGVRWLDVKRGLAHRDLARPILNGENIVEGHFLLHNLVFDYWSSD